MATDVYAGALDEATTRAWCERRRRTARTLRAVCAVMSIPGWAVLFALADAAGWISFAFWQAAAAVVLTFAALVWADLRLGRVRRYERILAAYPWQVHTGALFTAGNKQPYLRIPDPEQPGRSVTVRIRRPGVRRWQRLAGQGAGQELWFAGDPRIGGALALPGPAALSLARQNGAAGRANAAEAGRDGGSLRGVGEDALERARAAGFASDREFEGLFQRPWR
ncbi:hypothetical protein [Streptomyces sp. NPDC020917]|uniref:hypothetical protein n=1 Tax=Streptomyces sp. NPDC020917 TaxID=3365102 RepID=UPI00378AD458